MDAINKELSDILQNDIKEARSFFNNDDEFIQWIHATNEAITALITNKQLFEIIEYIFDNTSWGTHSSGGPVWVMDFSYENLKSVIPDNPLVPYFKIEEIQNLLQIGLGVAENFIKKTGVCNVLIIYPNSRSIFFTYSACFEFIAKNFYGFKNYAFLNRCKFNDSKSQSLLLMHEFRKIEQGDFITKIEVADQSALMVDFGSLKRGYWNYPFYDVNKIIYNNDCVWTLNSAQDVAKIDKLQDYLPLLMYDIMEFISANTILVDKGLYPTFRLPYYVEDHGYPRERAILLSKSGFPYKEQMDSYNYYTFQKSADSCEFYKEKLRLNLHLPELTDKFWHRQFPKKTNW